MKKWIRQPAIFAMVSVLALTTACTDQGNKQGAQANPSPQAVQYGDPVSTAKGTERAIKLNGDQNGVLPLRTHGKEDYIQATKFLDVVGYNKKWDKNQQVLQFGDNDAAYEIKIGSRQARVDEDQLTLKAAPLLLDGIPYLPVSALSDMMKDELIFYKEGNQLVFQPAQEQINLDVDQDGPNPNGDIMDFAEDPNDPFKAGAKSSSILPQNIDADGAITAATLRNIDVAALIARAKRYLGVRYEFGAPPYPENGTFDCSSYTKFIFGKSGVYLPRTARSQATYGNRVSRSSLRRGDLMFFYVPGRFQSNSIVGHVGIYIGDLKMIHASPKPLDGVQITDINKTYWKQTYLYAKRLVY